MKTWEVYKIALENPNAEFKRIGNTDVVHLFVNGEGKYRTSEGHIGDSLKLGNLNEEWEQIPREVQWQKAIEAWLNGKEIYVEIYGTKYTQKASFKFGCFLNEQSGFNKDCFKIGKWYIVG